MNKHIKSDIEQGLTFLKIAINNALADIEDENEKEITLEGSIALSLIIEVAESRKWIEDPSMDWDWTNGWEVDYFYYMLTPNKAKRVGIYGSLLNNTCVKLVVNNNDNE